LLRVWFHSHSLFDGVLCERINCEGAVNNLGSSEIMKWIWIDMMHPLVASEWIFSRVDEFLMGLLMDHGIWKWIKSYRTRGRFNSRRVYSLENEPGRWSPLASRVESTAYCELLLVNPSLSLSLSLVLSSHRSLNAVDLFNRIYRRTGGTTKCTYEEDASGHCIQDSDCLEIALYE